MKDAESDHLIEAIRDVSNGQTYIQPSVNKYFARKKMISVRLT